MGFLLLQYEFQRASREVTIHQRAGIRLNNQVTRLTKKVKDMQSLFDKSKSRLETELQTIQNGIKGDLQNAALGASTWTDLSGFASVLSGTKYGSYLSGYTSSILSAGESNLASAGSDATRKVAAINAALAQLTNIISTVFAQIKEAELTEIEEAENEQLAPISEKEADVQADKDLEDTLCSMWEQRRDNAKQKLPDAIKNQMAGYGLG